MTSIIIFGSFGPPTLAFARSCAGRGVSVYLLEQGEGDVFFKKYSSALAGQKTFERALIGQEEGLKKIQAYIDEVDATALIAVSENHLLWLSKNRNQFEPSCRLMAPSHECLERLAPKSTQIDIAREAGFELLPSGYLSVVEDCDKIPADNFPLCVRPSKPSMVTPSFKARVIYSPQDLKDFIGGFQNISAPIIAQPFKQLPDLKVIGVCGPNGRLIDMESFLVERKFEGVTLTLRKINFPEGLKEKCRKFLDLACLDGPFHFDLLYCPVQEDLYYLEINTRMGGITDKARSFGFDQPAMILESYGVKEKSSSVCKTTTRQHVVTKKSIIKHLITTLKGQLIELDYPPSSRIHHVFLSLRDLLCAKDSVFDWSDIRGSLWFIFQRTR